MKFFYCSSHGSWFVVKSANLKNARKEAVKEFGRGHIKEVRQATAVEVKEYKSEKGSKAIEIAEG